MQVVSCCGEPYEYRRCPAVGSHISLQGDHIDCTLREHFTRPILNPIGDRTLKTVSKATLFLLMMGEIKGLKPEGLSDEY